MTENIPYINKVVEGGFCVGCGACAFVANKEMTLNKYGEYYPLVDTADVKNDVKEKMEFVCPSLNEKYNEDVLGKEFLKNCETYSDKIGFYQSVYGGFVKEGNYRDRGTSGGFGTWIGAELFRRGLIDGVIHVKEIERTGASDPFFKYKISTTEEDIRAGSRTKYHVIEISEVLDLVKSRPGRYLFYGLPCMVKAIRRVQLVDPIINQSIKYTASLVCGHLKSVNWTLSLAWGKGVSPENVEKFQYRTKGKGIPARAYVFKAFFNKGNTTDEVMENSANVVGGKFNQGALMLPACNFCDDLVGETADITIGDAWLPQFEVDSNGTNLLIVRNAEINEVLNSSKMEERVELVQLTEQDAQNAQSGGFRQRKEGLSYRLELYDKKKKWHPIKRVKAGQYQMPPLRKFIYKMRYDVTAFSREFFVTAVAKNDYAYYKKKLLLQLKLLRFLEISSSVDRIVKRKLAYFKFRKLKKSAAEN